LDVEVPAFTHGFDGATDRFEWFAWEFTGKFWASQYGTHVLRLQSNDGAIVWIDDRRVVNNDGTHVSTERRGSVELSPGEHRIRVSYFHAARWERESDTRGELSGYNKFLRKRKLEECQMKHQVNKTICHTPLPNPVLLRLYVRLPQGDERPFGPKL
jgi:hypothetical protein